MWSLVYYCGYIFTMQCEVHWWNNRWYMFMTTVKLCTFNLINVINYKLVQTTQWSTIFLQIFVGRKFCNFVNECRFSKNREISGDVARNVANWRPFFATATLWGSPLFLTSHSRCRMSPTKADQTCCTRDRTWLLHIYVCMWIVTCL